MVGAVFGNWIVLSETDRRHGKRHFLCRCKCGVVKGVDKTRLTRGKSKSCGCYGVERIRLLNLKHNGAKNHRSAYSRWKNMRPVRKKSDV